MTKKWKAPSLVERIAHLQRLVGVFAESVNALYDANDDAEAGPLDPSIDALVECARHIDRHAHYLYNAEGRCRRIGHTIIPGGSTCTQCGAVEVDE